MNSQLMPSSAVYTFRTGEKIIGDGNNVTFPYVLSDTDSFVFGDYKYTYYKNIDGWHAEVLNKSKTKYDALYSKIADKPLLSLHETFKDCFNLVETPEIPDTVNDMRGTYSGCTSLRVAKLGKKVLDISYCFQNCSSLETVPEMPQSLRSMNFAFVNCRKLSNISDFCMSKEIMFMENAFENCVDLTQAPNLSKCFYLKTIKNAFKGCVSLEEIAPLPLNLENACGAFEGCTSLITKPLMPPNTQTDANTFKGCNNIS
jgi:hypothetical protein